MSNPVVQQVARRTWVTMLIAAVVMGIGVGIGVASARANAVETSLEEKCGQLVDVWKERFQKEKFSVVVSPPFVIAGEADVRRLEAYRDRTILASARALWAMYFDKRPDEPILILLFEEDASYRRLAREWLNDNNVPHFGYFRRDGVMVMNVGTGTGTLVHELAHALLSPDFPNCPQWFNEGLASLYEQCTIHGDEIRGLVNWRLPILQKALAEERVPTISQLMNDPAFYHSERAGVNYAMARYLMMFLQERGQLRAYYKEFRSTHKDDPTGLAALRKVVGAESMERFEKEFWDWVGKLR